MANVVVASSSDSSYNGTYTDLGGGVWQKNDSSAHYIAVWGPSYYCLGPTSTPANPGPPTVGYKSGGSDPTGTYSDGSVVSTAPSGHAYTGNITHADSSAYPGVLVTAATNAKSAVTDGSGNFSIGSCADGAETLTPSGPAGYDKLLLHLDSNFADSSAAGNTITPSGDAALSTVQKKFGTHSCLLSGAGYLSGSSDDFKFGTGDFTVDFWVYPTSFSGEACLYDTLLLGGAGARYDAFILVQCATTGYLRIYTSASYSSTSSSGLTLNAWNHVAIVYTGGHMKFYVGGTSVLDLTISPSLTSGGAVMGRYADAAGGYLSGYIDEVRVSKGIARWTTTFTPAASAYTDDATVETWSPTTRTPTMSGADVTGQNFTVGSSSDTQTATRGLMAWGAEGLSATRGMLVSGAEAVTGTRGLLGPWGAEGLSLTRGMLVAGRQDLTGTRGLLTAGAEVLAATRALLVYGSGGGETLTRSLQVFGLEVVAAARGLLVAGAEAVTGTRGLAAVGAESTSTARSLLVWGESSAPVAYPEYVPTPPRAPRFRVVAPAADLSHFTCGCHFDGADWLGAVRGADGAVLYRAAGGVVTPVEIPDSAEVTCVSAVATDGTHLYVASGYVPIWAQQGRRDLLNYRLDVYDGATWTESTWDRAAYENGTADAGSSELLWDGLLWGDAAAQYARGAWRRNPDVDFGTGYRLRPAGSLLIDGGSALLAEDSGAVRGLALPPGHTPNTLCWYGGRPWCLRYAAGEQFLCYGDPASGVWQDAARWPADSGGFYWFMRPWHGQLLLFGATLALTGAGDTWSAELAPTRGQFCPPTLTVAQKQDLFTQSLSEGSPMVALQASGLYVADQGAGGTRTLVVDLPGYGNPAGRVIQATPPGRGWTRGDVLDLMAGDMAWYGATGYMYVATEPALYITQAAVESRNTTLYAVEIEYADGSGDHTARLKAAEIEYARRAGRATLYAVEVEYADGSGDHTALLRAAEVQYADGYGYHQATLRAAEVEYAGHRHTARLAAAEVEYSTGGGGVVPVEGEYVLWTEPFALTQGPGFALRVIVPFAALSNVRCCLVRVDTGQPKDAWGTYDAFGVMQDFTLRETGALYRVALIGQGDAPDNVTINWNPG